MKQRLRVMLGAAAAATALLAWAGVASAQPAAPSGCETCHRDEASPALSAPAHDFGGTDVHRERGFTCVACHGGDPAATDTVRAKAPATGFRGKPGPQAIVGVCARCHSDAEFMRKYAPRQRVDQATEYAASVHGQRLAKGDTKVATCITCHGAHGIRLVSDAKSPVYALNVAATCTGCHADPAHMKGYTLPDGSPLPTDQGEKYKTSVHAAAMMTKGDLSAPTCNDCHGNHGAAPPGVGAVSNVCGTCHTVFATKFAVSTHSQIFDRACVECHSNHAIAQPSDALLGTDKAALCSQCHSEGDNGHAAALAMRAGIDKLKQSILDSGAALATAENAGIELGDEELDLREATNQLTLARTEVHTFDPKAVDVVLKAGFDITARVDQAAREGQAEIAFRRTGLAISLGAILIVVVALGLKVRELDRKHGVH